MQESKTVKSKETKKTAKQEEKECDYEDFYYKIKKEDNKKPQASSAKKNRSSKRRNGPVFLRTGATKRCRLILADQ